ncbi:FAD-dependent oxidoreductase [Candidatus Pacearchaeota archaeon]|nr:FAD-dependent oxidoreductase [Candidatus Pacearchaeota archaeon]
MEKEKEEGSKKSENYDFVVIGAGATGMAAAMYAGRLGLKTICLGATHGAELPLGGVITTTNIVENYPGFIKLTGEELANKIKEHALSYELVTLKEEKVEKIDKLEKNFIVKTSEGEYKGKAILFATGTKWKKLEVRGSKEFENRGIAYCALCDSPLYKNKTVGIVGGSDSAAKDALVLAEHAKKVYMIYRGEKIRPEPINMKRIEANKKIEIINRANVVEIKGDSVLKSIILDREYKGSKELKLEGLFVAIGHIILSHLAKSLGVKLNEKEEIVIDHKTSETNIPGVYAAGDVADKPFKQVITGVAEGCTAAYSAFEYISKNQIVPT